MDKGFDEAPSVSALSTYNPRSGTDETVLRFRLPIR
jgi:hypothetical protein